MAKPLHSYPWYPADWFKSETRHEMTMEERGLYRELLDYHYAEGSLPTNPETLRSITKATTSEWRRSSPRVLSKFLEKNGRLYNVRAEETLGQLSHYAEKRHIIAKKAAKARYEGVKKEPENDASSNASCSASSMHDECPTTTTSSTTTTTIEAAAPLPPTGGPPLPRIKTKPTAGGMHRPAIAIGAESPPQPDLSALTLEVRQAITDYQDHRGGGPAIPMEIAAAIARLIHATPDAPTAWRKFLHAMWKTRARGWQPESPGFYLAIARQDFLPKFQSKRSQQEVAHA